MSDFLRCKDCKHDIGKCLGVPRRGSHKNCFEQKVITNADRIRAMSDEELVKHLVDIGWDCHLCAEHRRLDNEPFLRGEKCDGKCEEHCLEWLQHPAG